MTLCMLNRLQVLLIELTVSSIGEWLYMGQAHPNLQGCMNSVSNHVPQ
jgi:hypothetical protein